jgi:hypothetical protein
MSTQFTFLVPKDVEINVFLFLIKFCFSCFDIVIDINDLVWIEQMIDIN